jgi:hypothetical protein
MAGVAFVVFFIAMNDVPFVPNTVREELYQNPLMSMMVGWGLVSAGVLLDTWGDNSDERPQWLFVAAWVFLVFGILAALVLSTDSYQR